MSEEISKLKNMFYLNDGWLFLFLSFFKHERKQNYKEDILHVSKNLVVKFHRPINTSKLCDDKVYAKTWKYLNSKTHIAHFI